MKTLNIDPLKLNCLIQEEPQIKTRTRVDPIHTPEDLKVFVQPRKVSGSPVEEGVKKESSNDQSKSNRH